MQYKCCEWENWEEEMVLAGNLETAFVWEEPFSIVIPNSDFVVL